MLRLTSAVSAGWAGEGVSGSGANGSLPFVFLEAFPPDDFFVGARDSCSGEAAISLGMPFVSNNWVEFFDSKIADRATCVACCAIVYAAPPGMFA